MKAIKASFQQLDCETSSAQHDDDSDNDSNSVGSDGTRVHSNPAQENLAFLTLHPGHRFTKHLSLKNWVVPMMYYVGVRLCSIFKLRMHDDECDENSHEWTYDYAKIS